MASTEAALSLPWYRSLSGPQWKTLVAANLSWTLDSFEFFALFITVGFALQQLVAPAEHAAIPDMRATSLPRPCSAGASAGCLAGSSPTISAASARWC
jgi:hypothetical protein